MTIPFPPSMVNAPTQNPGGGIPMPPSMVQQNVSSAQGSNIPMPPSVTPERDKNATLKAIGGELSDIWNNILLKPPAFDKTPAIADAALALKNKFSSMAEEFNQTSLTDKVSGAIPAVALFKAGKSVVKAIGDIKEQGSGNFVQSAATGVLHSLVTSPLELLSNRSGATGQPLTGDELANNVLNVASLVVAHKVGGLTNDTFFARKDLLTSSIPELAQASAKNVTGIGQLAHNIVQGTVVGAGAGGAQAAVMAVGDPDFTDKVIGGMVGGATAGGLLTAMFPAALNKGAEAYKNEARDLAVGRILATTGKSSMQDVMAAKASILGSDNIGQAAMRARLIGPNDVLHLTGISEKTFNDMLGESANNGLKTQVWRHLNDDGTYNVLAGGNLDATAKTFFERTGFVINQDVSWNGRTLNVKGLSGDQLKVSLNGNDLLIPYDQAKGLQGFTLGMTPDNVTDKLYQDWKNKTFGKALFTESLPDGFKLEDVMHDYVSKIGFDHPWEAIGITKVFEDKLFDDLMNTVEPIEKKNYYDLIDRTQRNTKNWGLKNFKNLNENALSNGLFVQSDGSNGYQLMESKSGKLMYQAKNMTDAFDYIHRITQDESVNLNDGLQRVAGQYLYPMYKGPGKAFAGSNDIYNPTVAQRVNASTRIALASSDFGLTRAGDYFNAFQTMFPKFESGKIYSKLRDAASLAKGSAAPFLDNIDKIDKQFGKFDDVALSRVSGWLDTASDSELYPRHAQDFSRELVDQWTGAKRDDGGNLLAHDPLKAIDPDRLFAYRDALRAENINQDAIQQGIDPKNTDAMKDFAQKKAVTLNQLATDLQVNTPEYQRAYKQFDQLYSMPKHFAPIFDIVRNVKAILNDGLDRDTYAIRHGMEPREVALGNALDAHYQMVANDMDMPDTARIYNYYPHIAKYENGNTGIASRDLGGDPWIHQLTRTGQLNVFEQNPILAARKYTNAAYQAMYLEPEISNAQEYINNNVANIGSNSHAQQVRGMFDNYIGQLKGVPNHIDKLVNTTVNRLFPGTSERTINSLATIMGNTFTLAYVVARPVIGLYHLATNGFSSLLYDGSAITAERLARGTEIVAHNPLAYEDLQRRGIIDQANPYTSIQNDGSRTTLDKTAAATGKVASAGMKLTGIRQMQDIWQAGTYMQVYDVIMNEVKNGLSINDIAQKVNLRSYDPSIGNNFASLWKSSKFTEAADYMARTAVRERVGVFDKAENGKMFQNVVGRVFGQFGTYPNYIISQLGKLATNGTASDIFARGLRYAAITYAMKELEDETGLNLGKLLPHHAFEYTGGPALDSFKGGAQWIHDAASVVQGDKEWSDVAPKLQQDDGSIQPHALLPGSLAIHGISKAIIDARQGANPWFVIGEGIGLPQQR